MIRLLRMKDWIKNIIMFFPLVFLHPSFLNITHLCIAFLGVSCFASINYIVNDYIDQKTDKKEKSYRITKYSFFTKCVIMFLLFIFGSLLLSYLGVYLEGLLFLGLALNYNFIKKMLFPFSTFYIGFLYIMRIYIASLVLHVTVPFLFYFGMYLFVISLTTYKRLPYFPSILIFMFGGFTSFLLFLYFYMNVKIFLFVVLFLFWVIWMFIQFVRIRILRRDPPNIIKKKEFWIFLVLLFFILLL